MTLTFNIIDFIEPLKLSLEKKYYLNVIKEISVTDSYLSMDKDVRGCQKESYDECTARKYRNALMNNCQCLPFQLIQSKKVGKRLLGKNQLNLFLILRLHCVLQNILTVFQASKLTIQIVFSNVLE